MSTPYREKWTSDCGTVTLYCGDCLEILPTIEAGSVDAVVTDPPYEITASGGGIVKTRRDLNATKGFTDCGFDYEILRPFRNWMCFGTLRQVPKLIEIADSRRWMLITWNKQNPCPLVNGNYLPDTEYIIHAWSRGGLYGDFADKSRYIVHPLGDKEHGEHPNEKPYPVMRKLIATSSDRRQLVADPYMGSGTTGVACVRLGRRFIGIELEPKYYAIAKRRIQDELSRVKFLEPPKRDTQRTLVEVSQ